MPFGNKRICATSEQRFVPIQVNKPIRLEQIKKWGERNEHKMKRGK